MPSFNNELVDSLTFVSVEGFWEKEIHDARVAEAAEKLQKNPFAFAIVTATHAPAGAQSFTAMPLGKYTADKLIADYKIEPMRILPAYLFSQKTTYTIIDAYSNAIMIGWVCCGLSSRSKKMQVRLEPVTAGYPAQTERIMALNNRALKSLNSLSINFTIQSTKDRMSMQQLLAEYPEEGAKLKKLYEHDSVLEAGQWEGNSGIKRSFDDVETMRDEILAAFQKTFGEQMERKKLFNLSDIERVLLTLVWSAKANSEDGEVKDWNVIYDRVCEYFKGDLTSVEVGMVKNRLGWL